MTNINSATRNRVDGTVPLETPPTNSSTSTGHDRLFPTSASDHATKPAKSEGGTHQVELDLAIHEVVPKSTTFKPIQDLQLESKSFPRWACHPDSPHFRHMAPFYGGLVDRLCATFRAGEYHFHDNVDGCAPGAFLWAIQGCVLHESAHSEDYSGLEDKRAFRNGGDRMLSYTSTIEKGRLMYRTNRELRLPAFISNRLDTTTPADGLGLIDIQDFEPFTSSPEFREAVAAACVDPSPPCLILVHYVASYAPKGSAENEMKMCMVSALHQKKVLGMRDQFVFGIFQFDTDYLQVVAGIWQDDEMKLYKVGVYSLRDPALMSEFFYILMGIKRIGAVYKDEIVATGPALLKAVQADPPRNEWAQEVHDRS